MVQSFRLKFAESIRQELSSLCHIQFSKYASYENDDSKSAPAFRYYFAPTNFHYAMAGERDDKRVGFLVEFERRGSSARSIEIGYGFEIIHNYWAGTNLKRATETRPIIAHLISELECPKVVLDLEESKFNPNHNLGYFRSEDGTFLLIGSGLGNCKLFDPKSPRDWDRFFKSYPWIPKNGSATKTEKSYFTIETWEQLHLSKGQLQSQVQRISKELVRLYMPLLDACAIGRLVPMVSPRPNSARLNHAIDLLYGKSLRCAVTGKRLHIQRCHLVAVKDFRDCGKHVRELADSPANVLPLTPDLHRVQETEQWYVAPKGKVRRGSGPKSGSTVRLKYLSHEHRRLLRDLRPLAKIKPRLTRRLR